jgi:hypothetical protein
MLGICILVSNRCTSGQHGSSSGPTQGNGGRVNRESKFLRLIRVASAEVVGLPRRFSEGIVNNFYGALRGNGVLTFWTGFQIIHEFFARKRVLRALVLVEIFLARTIGILLCWQPAWSRPCPTASIATPALDGLVVKQVSVCHRRKVPPYSKCRPES